VSKVDSDRHPAARIASVLAAVSAILLVALLVLSFLAFRPTHGWYHQARSAKNDAAAGQAALDAARADLIDITTYGYASIDKDFDWLSDFSDPKTAEPFAKSQKSLAKVVKGSKTVAKGSVVDAMSRVVSDNQVEILAFVDQVLRSNIRKGYSLEQQRVSMTMVRVDGTWKISRLDLLGSNNAS
jgi:Mce-associated membrane protein